MFSTFLVVVASIVFYLWFQDYWKTKKFRKLRSQLPGPTPRFLLGNVLEFGTNPVAKTVNLVRLQNTYGPILILKLGLNEQHVLISDPDVTEYFLKSSKNIDKSADYDWFKDWLGKGLLTATGSYWHKKRKMLTPSFHFKILDEFFPVFNNTGEIFIERLYKVKENEIFDVYPYVTAYTLDTICETAMGTFVNAQKDINNEYVTAVANMREVFINRVFSVWKKIGILYRFSEDYKKHQKSLKIIIDFTKTVITKRRQQMLKSMNGSLSNDNVENEFGVKKKVAFLDMLLKSTIDGRPLTDDEIREEVDTFMFEGHDTTASAISFALYLIANHPDVQEKLVEELHSVYGNNKIKEDTIQDMQELKYMELVIKEVLRLYPSVPMVARKVTEDAEINGIVYQKGLNVILFTYHLQRREDLFPDADKFIPERFLNENMSKKNSYIYAPFSAGPRNCIGQKFAMYEIKSILSKILRHFELISAGPKYELNSITSDIILKNDVGTNISIRRRNF